MKILCLALALACSAAAQPKLKVLISADMEGVAGVTNWKIEAQPGTRDYGQFRKLFTAEVNAAVAGAYDGGATDVLVVDSHGDFANLDPDVLDQRVRYIRGYPRPLGMMQGIDKDVDAVALVGYHAAEGAGGAILAHTFTGSLTLSLNGAPASETTFSAAIAADFGVPVVFLSGDRAAAEEAQRLIPHVETAVVKEPIGFRAGVMIAPEAARKMIREGIARGIQKRREIPVRAVAHPVRMDIRFKDLPSAEMVAYLPGADRVQSDTVRITAPDMAAASKVMIVVIILAAASRE